VLSLAQSRHLHVLTTEHTIRGARNRQLDDGIAHATMAPSRVSPPPPSDLSSGLTKEQLQFWDTNGYLLIPDALSKDTVKELYDESNTLLNDFSLDDHPMTKFSTGEKSDHVGDSYFLESGDKVRFFFEEGRQYHTALANISASSNTIHQMLSTQQAP
jgi:hypothetical protein